MPDVIRPLSVRSLLARGAVSYADGLGLQRELVASRQAGAIPDTLVLLEHAPVVTHGRLADPLNQLADPEEFAESGIELAPTDRGGDYTYHGPGQLTGYPIVHLGEGSRDIHQYVRALEEVLIRTSHAFGVVGAGRSDWHAGVWVEDRYLAALGVKVSRWVTHHGFALNVDSRIHSGFRTIVACGMAGKRVTSLAEECGREVAVADVALELARHFADVFGYGEPRWEDVDRQGDCESPR
jgi:lipoate-protein ligase B